MTMQEICAHERAEMALRKANGYGQHDAHVWTWLLYWLAVWNKAHPIRVTPEIDLSEFERLMRETRT